MIFELLLKLDVLPLRHRWRNISYWTEGLAREPSTIAGDKVGVHYNEVKDFNWHDKQKICAVHRWYASITDQSVNLERPEGIELVLTLVLALVLALALERCPLHQYQPHRCLPTGSMPWQRHLWPVFPLRWICVSGDSEFR